MGSNLMKDTTVIRRNIVLVQEQTLLDYKKQRVN